MKKKVFIINGSASENSSNQRLIGNIIELSNNDFDSVVYSDLKTLPHFDPELSITNTPKEILELREQIESSDGIIICTPEYVFSIPSGLKNAIEWCISTTIFSNKPTGLITASASGEMGHKELQLIMKTAMAKFTPETTLLIQGIKGKIDLDGRITNSKTKEEFMQFISNFIKLLNE